MLIFDALCRVKTHFYLQSKCLLSAGRWQMQCWNCLFICLLLVFGFWFLFCLHFYLFNPLQFSTEGKQNIFRHLISCKTLIQATRLFMKGKIHLDETSQRAQAVSRENWKRKRCDDKRNLIGSGTNPLYLFMKPTCDRHICSRRWNPKFYDNNKHQDKACTSDCSEWSVLLKRS